MGLQTGVAAVEHGWRFLKKLKIGKPYDLVTPVTPLGIYSKKIKILIEKLYALLCLLHTIAKIWKQPKCPLIDKWIRKMWYIL